MYCLSLLTFIKNMKISKLFFIILLFTSLITLSSCGMYKKVDQRQMPDGADAKARKNIEEGKGVSIGGLIGKRGRGATNYEFSTSNPMWRASLEILDFLPLSTVDYSGGMIITDWYSTSNNENERCKLNIFIMGKKLNTENLKVKSFCQEYKNPTWVNKETEVENNIKIENAILNKAKKLKLQSS